MAENRNFTRNVIPILTKIAHGATPFITTFLLIHLSAPALASLGGSSLASQTMLLGREYYQTSFGEKYLLLAPLALHAVAGVAKRIISPRDQAPRPLTSLISLTGYATLLFFLPVHFMTHRLNPTIEAAPIFSVGPSELDFEFVKVGLQTWPWRSTFLYVGLILTVVLHAVDGFAIVYNTWLKRIIGRQWRRNKRQRNFAIALGGVVLPVLAGIYTMWKEPILIFTSTAKRFQASFLQSLVFRL